MEDTKTLFYASAVQPNPGEVQYWIDLKRDPYGNAIKSFDASIGKWILLNYDSTIYRVFDILGIPYDKDTGEASWPNLGEGSVFGGNTLVDALTKANDWATNLRNNVGKPGGLTPLNENGQVDSQFLPSYVDDVVDVYATYTTDATGAITNIQLWKNKECTKEITSAQAERDKIYVDIAPHKPNGDTIKVEPVDEDAVYPSYQFRWSGSQWVWINGDHLIIGDITGTAFDGGKGKHLEDVAEALPPTILSATEDIQYAPEYVRVPFEQYSKEDNDVYTKDDEADYKDIKSATETDAGVMPAYLYQFTYDVRNTLPDHLVTGIYLAEAHDSDVTILTKSANKKSLDEQGGETEHKPYDKVSRDDKFTEEHKEDDHKYLDNLVIKAASETQAGVLTKEQFIKFNNTIPSLLDAEIHRSKEKDNELTTKDTLLEGRLGRLEHELNKEWTKHLDDFNTVVKSVGLDDHKHLPDLQNTHYLNNNNKEDDQRDNVDSVVGCLTVLDDELHKLSGKVDAIPNYQDVKGCPDGLAELGQDGKVKTEQLPSFVDDVIDVYATYSNTQTGQLQNIKLYTDAEHQHEVQGEIGKIYVNVGEGQPNYQFRWTGSVFAHIDSNVIIIGKITGTAFDGGEGEKIKVKSESLPEKLLSTIQLTQNQPDKVVFSLTGKQFNAEEGKYVDSTLTDLNLLVASENYAGLLSKEDKAKLDKVVTDLEAETTERRKQDDAHSERIGALRNKAKEVDDQIKADLAALTTKVEGQGEDLEELQTKVDEAIQTGKDRLDNLDQELSRLKTHHDADIADQRAVDEDLRNNDAQLERKIEQAKNEVTDLANKYNSQLEKDLADVQRENQNLKETDIRHQAAIDELGETNDKLAEEIKALAQLVGLEEKQPSEGEGDEFELPTEDDPVMIGEASSVFDAVEKLDKGAVPWTKEPADDSEAQKKYIDLPKTSQLRGTIDTTEREAPATKEVPLAGISTVNVGYFTKKEGTETELPTMQQSELGNTDIHSELKSNDRPTVEVVETVQKYTDNAGAKIINMLEAGVMTMDSIMPIATDTLTTTKEHYHKHIAYSQDELWYGVRFDMGKNNGVPDGIRTGNLDMHRDLPIQSKMRGCVIQDNGDTIKYLNPTDWKKYEDNTDVQDDTSQNKRVNFFVEIPEHYRLFLQTPDNNIEIRISEYNLPGYTHVEKKYIGAYEATTDPAYAEGEEEATKQETSNLEYKVLWSRPDWQKPVVNMTREAMQKAARKSQDIVASEHNRTNHWNMYTYDAHTDMTWLFVVEYATLYSQKDFNKALTPEGYHQGGLGKGVTTGVKVESTTVMYSFVPAGVTHVLGSNTGIVCYDDSADGKTTAKTCTGCDKSESSHFVNGSQQVDSTTYTTCSKTEVPRYRGIENPFGHVWKNTVDVIVSGDGSKPHDVYICRDWTKFKDTVSGTITKPTEAAVVAAADNNNPPEGYNLQPFKECPKQGWLKEIVGTNWGDLFCKECNGGATKYYTDYHQTYIENGTTTARTLLIGGRSGGGSGAGLFDLPSDSGVGVSSANVGTRLTFYGEPKNEQAAVAAAIAYAMQPQYEEGPDAEGQVDTHTPLISIPHDGYVMNDDNPLQ